MTSASGIDELPERDRFAAHEPQLAADPGPVITDFPIWVAGTMGARALALPEEPPADVLDLAATFEGTRTLVVLAEEVSDRMWPSVLESGMPGSECFAPIELGTPSDPRRAAALADVRVFRIECP